MSKTAQWWQKPPVTKFGTTTDLTLSTGAVDVEKGNIYSVPAGTPVAVPVAAKVAWEDSQHVVLQTSKGILNLLHVSPTAPVGSDLKPNQPFGVSSPLVGSYRDPRSGMTYVESGNILEFGWYDTVKRAVQRENYVNGVDRPYDFTGIADPTPLINSWNGLGPSGGSGPIFASFIPLGTNTDHPTTSDKQPCALCRIVLFAAIAILVIVILRRLF